MTKKPVYPKKLAKAILTLTNVNSDGTKRETLTIDTVGIAPIKMTYHHKPAVNSRYYEILFGYTQASVLDMTDEPEQTHAKYHGLTTIGATARELTLNGLALKAKGNDLFVLSQKSTIFEMTLLNPHINILNITELAHPEEH